MSKKSNQETRSLNSANKNPWYVLMTLYDNHEENQRVWNSWMTGALSPEERKSAEEQLGGINQNDMWWASNQHKVREKFKEKWIQRNPELECPPLPDPKAKIDFSRTGFSKDTPFNAEGMVFPECSFKESSFDQRTDFLNTVFWRSVDFDFSEFVRGATFHSTRFESSASFTDTRFIGSANFTETVFSSKTENVNFSRAEFGSPGHRNSPVESKSGGIKRGLFGNIQVHQYDI